MSDVLKVDTQQKNAWVALGLGLIERQLAGSPVTGLFCHGKTATMADCCLVPQLYNARLFD